MDTRQWILDSGYWTVDTGQWTLDSGYWTADTGQWILDRGYWTVDTGQRILYNEFLSQDKTFASCLKIDFCREHFSQICGNPVHHGQLAGYLMVTQCTALGSTVSNGNPVHHAL